MRLIACRSVCRGCVRMQTERANIQTMNHRAEILSGRTVAEEIKAEVRQTLERLVGEHNVKPCLAVVRVGDDPASLVYVRNKVRTSTELGFNSEHHALSAATTTEELFDLLQSLNERDDVDGILVQLPLPAQINEESVLASIDPLKDVDGFHPFNTGLLARGRAALAPCTPAGIIELLERNRIEIKGTRACVVGRSHIVGRPIAEMLLQRDATVTICHSRTPDLAAATSDADILVVAVGRINLIRGKHVKPGATVIDVGMNSLADEKMVDELFGDKDAEERRAVIRRKGATLVGDVNQREVEQVAGRLTPVPGGVGLLTIAMLMKNTALAAMRRRNL